MATGFAALKEDLVKFRRSKNFVYYLVSFGINFSVVIGTMLGWLTFVFLPFESQPLIKFEESQGFWFVNETLAMVLSSLLGIATFAFWFANKGSKFVTKLARLKWVNEE